MYETAKARRKTKMPDPHSLKEEKFIVLAHVFSVWSAGSKAERCDGRGWQRKAAHILAARKQRGREEQEGTHVHPPRLLASEHLRFGGNILDLTQNTARPLPDSLPSYSVSPLLSYKYENSYFSEVCCKD